MRKLFLISTLLLIGCTCYAQLLHHDSTLTTVQPIDYLQKSKKQKTGAWVLLGVSAVSSISGFGILLNQTANAVSDGGNDLGCILGGCPTPPQDTYNDSKATGGVVLMGLGVATFVSSIVLFTKSSKNKRKAMSVSYRLQKAPLLQSVGEVTMRQTPVVTFTFAL